MHKYLLIISAFFLLCGKAQAQVGFRWDELPKQWYLNSAGYPAEEPALDKMYYRLIDFQLTLNTDSTYKVAFSKDSSETGKFMLDRGNKTLSLIPSNTGKKLIYSVVELNAELFTLTTSEKYTWAYYLSLTSHR